MQYKRRPEMDVNGFYGDVFSHGRGDFYPIKKRLINQGFTKNIKGLVQRLFLRKDLERKVNTNTRNRLRQTAFHIRKKICI